MTGSVAIRPAVPFEGAPLEALLVRWWHTGWARTLDACAFNRDAIAFYDRRTWRRFPAFEATELGVPALTYSYRRTD